MKYSLSKFSFFFSGITLYPLIFTLPAKCQISVDGTTPTNLDRVDNVVEITGGTEAGSNLFHSFSEFSVPTNNEAFFNNADNIDNIINRVTGGSISNIDGLIRANGGANLFLINPAGIIFGQNASLSIGGSFFGSTADSVIFPEGEFSATDIQSPVILTINAPIGLRFRDNPGSITNRSQASQDGAVNGFSLLVNAPIPAGLQTSPGQTLALVGGELNIENGNLSAPGGRIELGSVAGNSFVSISPMAQGFTLGYEQASGFEDIQLSQFSLIDTTDTTGINSSGVIKVQGKQINITDASNIFSINLGQEQGGQLEIKASDAVRLIGDDASILTLSFGNGAAGDIKIETDDLSVIDGGAIASVPGAIGSSGKLQINASNSVEVSGERADGLSASFIGIQPLDPAFIGDSQELTIETNKLTIQGGAQVSSSTFGAGQAGNLIIRASEIEISGATQSQFPSGIGTQADTDSSGNAGNIIIETERLTATDGGVITAATFGSGDGGDLTVTATDSINLSGTTSSANLFRGSSGLFTSTDLPSSGNGGDVTVTTPQLIVENGAKVSAETFGSGNAGNVNLNVARLIVKDGGQVRTGSLFAENTSNRPLGRGGNLIIKGIDSMSATESIEVTGTGEINGETVNSSLFTLAEGTGDAGNLNITTNQLTVANGGEINASAIGTGAAGELSITAKNIDLNRGKLTATTAAGSGGNINLDIAQNLTLENQSLISAQATEEADGGNVTINSEFIIAFPSNGDGNDIIANAQGGDGGDINITAEALLGIEERRAIPGNRTNDIDASSEFGLDGNVTFNVPDTNNFQETAELSSNVISAQAVAEDACSPGAGESGLVLLGKGGVPPTPDSPLSAAILLVDGKPITPKFSQLNNQQTTQNITSPIQPMKTSVGDIYLARGVIVREDGTVTLTAYPTPGTPGYRPYQQKIACQVKRQ